ncbi:MAG: GIY-YIG nuclease family protein [Oscillospiraceae bacterium]|nr:GIY-YIG nuclease family protein [Oscillospiraceae bacterium]
MDRVEAMSYFVYVLRCADDTLYTGWTTDIEGRLTAHNRGIGAKYTRSRRPVELVHSESLPDKQSAMRREWAIKQMSRAKKLALIAGNP